MEGTHEPLVTQEVFDMANAKAFTHVKKNMPAGRKAHPLLCCPCCGRRIRLTGWGNAYCCGQASISGIPECKTIHVNKEKLENTTLSCTRAMAGMAVDEAARKKKEFQRLPLIEKEIRMLEAEKKRLSGRKLRIYEDYRSERLTKEQYSKEYETVAIRIQEIEERIPELKDEIAQMKEHMNHLEEQEAELEILEALQTFDKEKLGIVIDSVQVYSEDRIEIVWKMDNWFFRENAMEKEVLAVK